jgi:hypothetical protein
MEMKYAVYSRLWLPFLVLISILVISCGEKQDDVVQGPDQCLPASIDDLDARRTSEIETYPGQSLWEYINGGAEIYHQYQFEEVAAAHYEIDDIEVVTDIYKFSSSANAYGLYTTVRPDDPELIVVGIGGFISANSLTFVKGEYVVRLTSYSSGDEIKAVLGQMAKSIESCLPGTVERPAEFGDFSENYMIPNTDKYLATSFQGQAFLSEFFTQDYYLDGDTVSLFISLSDAANKLSQWREAVAMMNANPVEIGETPFPSDDYLAAETFYGIILGGVKNNRLVGMINYSDRHKQFFTDWLNSLP